MCGSELGVQPKLVPENFVDKVEFQCESHFCHEMGDVGGERLLFVEFYVGDLEPNRVDILDEFAHAFEHFQLGALDVEVNEIWSRRCARGNQIVQTLDLNVDLRLKRDVRENFRVQLRTQNGTAI